MAAPAAAALAVAAVAPTIISAFKAVRDLQPFLEDEVTVEVRGQPGHNKQNLYFLALAAANGVVRRIGDLNGPLTIIAPGYGLLMAEYDPTDNWVRCTIKYRVGMWSAAVKELPFIGSLPGGVGSGRAPIFDRLVLYRGPQCNVVGGTFDFVSNTPIVSAGIPDNAASKQAPQLPFAGQMIATPCPTTPTPTPAPITQSPAPDYPLSGSGITIPSPNPKPPGDNRSRGAVVTPPNRTTVSLSGSMGTGTAGAVAGGIAGLAGGVAGGTGINAGKCCDTSLSLTSLVYAALSSPATNSRMTFQQAPTDPTKIG